MPNKLLISVATLSLCSSDRATNQQVTDVAGADFANASRASRKSAVSSQECGTPSGLLAMRCGRTESRDLIGLIVNVNLRNQAAGEKLCLESSTG